MDRLTAMKAFVRLVEVGSFTKVGAELQVKQSTVSKWIAALEDQLGAQLIQRTSRHQRVTDSGQLFYARSKEILAAFEDAEAALSQRAPTLRGRLRVSVPVVFGRLFVLPHAATFAADHPDLELELRFDDRYVNLLEEGFDVAIRVGRPVDSSLRAKTLAVTHRHAVASPDYLARAGTPLRPEDLKDHTCLRHSSLSTDGIWRFGQGEQSLKTLVGGRLSANNSEALLTMAREGLGVAVLASWLVGPDLDSGALVPILTDFDLPPAPVQALTPPTQHMHPRVRAFLDFMADALRGLT